MCVFVCVFLLNFLRFSYSTELFVLPNPLRTKSLKLVSLH